MRQDLVDWITTVSKTNTIDWIYNSLTTTGYIEHQFIEELTHVFGEEAVKAYFHKLKPVLELPQAYPDPKINSKNIIVIEGRVCSVLFEVKLPRIIMVDNFLTDTECEELIRLSEPGIKRSLVISSKEDKSELNDARTSSGTFLNNDHSPLIAIIDKRIEALTNWPASHQETMQILKYMPGEEYKPHNDYFDPKSVSTPTILKRGGQRLATFIMYLNNCHDGGSTIFPETGIEVKPKKGCAVFFSYPTHDKQSKTLHGGSPVVSGEKWIAVKWFRQNVFA